MYSSDELFQLSREGYLGVYFPSCKATREKNTTITLEWAQKQFITRVHALFYFLHDTTNPQMTTKTMIFTHRPHLGLSLARFWFCWWHHNGLLMTSQWPDNCDAIMWIMISNSLDIDIIHCDIHGGSCKKQIIYVFNGNKIDIKIKMWMELPSKFHLVLICLGVIHPRDWGNVIQQCNSKWILIKWIGQISNATELFSCYVHFFYVKLMPWRLNKIMSFASSCGLIDDTQVMPGAKALETCLAYWANDVISMGLY